MVITICVTGFEIVANPQKFLHLDGIISLELDSVLHSVIRKVKHKPCSSLKSWSGIEFVCKNIDDFKDTVSSLVSVGLGYIPHHPSKKAIGDFYY